MMNSLFPEKYLGKQNRLRMGGLKVRLARIPLVDNDGIGLGVADGELIR